MHRNHIILIAISAAILTAAGGIYIIQPRLSQGAHIIVISTTTSLYDTGILDMLEDEFETLHPIDLRFVSVGTGLAISYGERGDADMILVHAPPLERPFLEEGYGVNRKILAYNFFSIIGPPEDPAGIHDKPLTEALRALVEKGQEGGALWISRGDESGTHAKEKEIWRLAGFDASALREEEWYKEAGAGMGRTLQVAWEYEAYTLTDKGTYLRYKNEGLTNLEVMVTGGEDLINVYSAIAVNPSTAPDVNFDDSMTFIQYLASEEGQAILGSFGVETYGTNLFNPAVELLETRTDPFIAECIEAAAFFEGTECPVEYRRGEYDLYG
ncbi:MAG: substrate-binding domain-containing protein [Candidatus Bathyarchaeota archaeon]|nr:MAG: substrate-binding domain-containing protein [Candidatus Bathyarchaeota archaeon]